MKRWELFVVLILFVMARISALHYPFYWDESWSYAPAVKLMCLHGPSLMPNAIDLFYSRGHPLLFYASAAAWMKIFGASFVAQHCFSLLVSLLVMVSVYEVCLGLFNKRVALLSLLLLPLQVMFFVQSTFLLPEVMIGLFSLLSLYFYVANKNLLTFLCCTALMLTKESGMVMGLVLGVHATLNLFNRGDQFRNRLTQFVTILGSGITVGLYFLLQKKLNGWYFYPEHTGYIQWDWHIFWDKFRFALDMLFCHDYRFRLFQLIFLLAIIVAVQYKNLRYVTPLLPGYLVHVIIEDKFAWLPRQVLFGVFLVSLVFTAYQLVKLQANQNKSRTRFIYLSLFFLMAYLSFTCINFFTARYLLCVLVIVLILGSIFIDVYITALYKQIWYFAIASIAVISFYGFKYDTGLGDINLGSFDGMAVQENVISYLEKADLYDRSISTASFQEREHLQKPYTGFLHSGKIFKNISYSNQASDFVVFDNIEGDDKYESIKNNPGYHLVYQTSMGAAWAEVYEKLK